MKSSLHPSRTGWWEQHSKCSIAAEQTLKGIVEPVRAWQVLRARIGTSPHQRLSYQCSTFHTQSALYPIIEHIENAARFGRDDSVEQKLDKLDAFRGAAAHGTQAGALFASLLSLPTQRYAAINYSPQKQKELLLAALVDHIAQLSRHSPVLVAVEDMHWADPTIHETLDLLVSHLPTLRTLLVLTHRPEYAPRWSGETHVSHLVLNRLNPRLAAQMTQKVSGGKPLPPEVLEQIVAKTDGVPLFVEELTKAVLEFDLIRETSTQYELT